MTGESLSFGGVADRYDRARPGYPVEAARWLTGDAPARVLELGAGTGKLTRTLVELGHNVMASDPDERMLAVLEQRAPGAHVRTHGAEDVPLPDAIADVVISAQAWHWFDHERAIPEIARVLKPGGVLALVWNERDETVPWVARLGRLMGSNDNQDDQVAALRDQPEFPEIEEATFRHWQHLDRKAVLDLAASRSYVASMGEEEREETLARVSALYDDYGRGPDGMKLPYVTRCFRASVHHRQVSVPGRSFATDDLGEETTDPAFSPGPLRNEPEAAPAPAPPRPPDAGPVAPAPMPRPLDGSDGSAGRGVASPGHLAPPPSGPTWRAGTFPDEATLLIDFR
ncbi:hypothetical protein GCM10011519_24280 [Marmoricola endophyticus]|uniref:Methyltransferase type 11 domain-containing protein n=1 Tax=Marmoricola endophyticus TaxID=2040280 RepID=A0A917F3I7_9ACTN|nr:class I SAM-dependent methyltransferase [Marmoricola endophyticus]GGF49473.1 hypothetical protein GCM10011519_24280 [Marmoricola endophyticus]